MIFAQPVLIELEEIVAREFLCVIRAWPAREEFPGENAHHRIRFARRVIDQAVGELRMRVGINGVEQDRDPALVAGVYESVFIPVGPPSRSSGAK